MPITIEFRETEETIELIVYPISGEPETYYLDADDTNWELTLNNNGNATEFRTSTNGDFT